MADSRQALRDFVATSNSGKYKNEDELMSKFPELKAYSRQALRDFVATSNSGKYKNEDELLSKFPEFNAVKKKEATPAPKKKDSFFSSVTKMVDASLDTSKPKTAQKPSGSSGGKAKQQVFTGYPGKEDKKYILDESTGKQIWKETVSGGKLVNGKAEFKIRETPITDPARVVALNKQFNKNASTDINDQVFTGYPGKELNEYRINNGTWQRRQPKATSWTDLNQKNTIDALNSQFKKSVKYYPAKAKFDLVTEDENAQSKKDLDTKLVSVNSKLIGGQEEDAVRKLSLQFPGFRFLEQGAFTDEILVIAPNDKRINISLDNWTHDDDINQSSSLREFIKANSNASLDKAREKMINAEAFEEQWKIKPVDVQIKLGDGAGEERELMGLTGTGTSIEMPEKDIVTANVEAKLARSEYFKKSKETFQEVNDRHREAIRTTGNIDNIDVRNAYANLDNDISVSRSLSSYMDDIADQNKSITKEFEYLQTYTDQIKDKVASGEISEEEFNTVYAPKIEQGIANINSRSESLNNDVNTSTANENAINKSLAENLIVNASKGSFGGGIANNLATGLTDILRLGAGAMGANSSDTKKLQTELVRSIVGTGTTEEYMASEDRSDISKTLFSLAKSMGQLATGGVAGKLATGAGATTKIANLAATVPFYAGGYYEMKDQFDDPSFSGVSDAEKVLLSTLYGTASGILEKYGLTKALGKSPMGKGLTNRILKASFKDLPKNASSKMVELSIENSIKKQLVSRGVNTIGAYLVEASTEAAQELTQVGLQEVYDLAKKNNYFKNGTGWDIASRVWESALLGGLGGGIMGTVSQSYGMFKDRKKLNNVDSVKLMQMTYNDANMRDLMLTNIKNKILNKEITAKEGKAMFQAVQQTASILTKLPDNLNDEQTLESVNLLVERTNIEKEIEGKDVNLVATQKARVAEINNELTKISEDATKEISVQEGGTSEYQGTSEGQQEVGISEGSQRKTTQPEADRGDSTVPSEVQQEEVESINNRILKIEEAATRGALLEDSEPGELKKLKDRKKELESTPEAVIEQPTTTDQVATLRAEEQAELADVIPNIEDYKVDGEVDKTLMTPEDLVKYNEVYDKYDKLITPLLPTTEEIVPGKRAVVSGIEITYPTEEQKAERVAARSTAEFVETASQDLPIEDVNILFEELGGEFGVLTAENPLAQPLTDQENKSLNQKAVQWLESRGYKPRRETGKYDQGENSFFVPNLSKEDAIAFAIEFNQESVAHSEGLIYQDGSMNPRDKSSDDFSFSEYNPESNFVSVVRTPDGLKTYSIGYDFANKIPASKPKTGPTVEQEVEAIGQLLSGTDQEIDTKIVNKKIVKAVAKAKKALSKIIPGTKFVVHNTNEEYQKAVGEDDRSQVSNGTFDIKKNTIHINGTNANARTIAHEVFHAILINKVGLLNAAAVTKKMVEAIASKINNNPELKKKLDNFLSNYEENIQNEEKLAELVGMLAENYNSFSASVKDIITRWINKLAGIFGLDPFNSNETYDMLKTIAKKVAKGKVISEADVNIIKDIDNGESFENQFINTNGTVVETKSIRKSIVGGTVVSESDLIDPNTLVGKPLEVVYYDNFTSSPYELKNRISGSTIKRVGEGGPGYSYRPEIKKARIIAAFTNVTKVLNSIQGIRSRNNIAKDNAVIGVALQNKETGHLGNKTTERDFYSPSEGVIAQAINDKLITENEAVVMLKGAVDAYASTSKGSDPKSSLGFTSNDFSTLDDFYKKIGAVSFERRGTFNAVAIPSKEDLKITKATKPYVITWLNSGIPTLKEYFNATTEQYTKEAEAHDIVKYLDPELDKIGVDSSVTISETEKNRAKEMGVKIETISSDLIHTSYPVVMFGKNIGVPTTFHSVRDMSKDWDVPNPFFKAGRRSDKAQPITIPETKASEKKPYTRKQLSPEVSSKLTEDKSGNFVFHHYSNDKRDTIKPGTGQNIITGQEESGALSAVGGLAMYYTMDNQVEPGVGNVLHTVLVPNGKVYDFNQDPDNFYDEAKKRFEEARPSQSFSPNYQLAFITQVANENGYDMVVARWRNNELRAQTTMELDASKDNVPMKAIAEETYKVGDNVEVYGAKGKITSIDGDMITFKGDGVGGAINFKRFPKEISKQITPRKQIAEEVTGIEQTIAPRKQKPKSINDIVKLTKDQGFSDAAIRQYLKDQGYSDKQATASINEYNVKKEGIFVKRDGGIPTKIADSIKSFKRRMFSARAFLPKSVFSARENKEASIARHLNIVDQNVKDFNRLYSKYKGDKKELVDNFDKYIRGDKDAKLSDEFLAVANSMRNQIDGLSIQLINSGLVDESMAKTIKDNMGQYLTRSYKIYDRANWKKEVEEEVKHKAINLLKSQYREMAQEISDAEGIPLDEALDNLVTNRLDEMLTTDGASNFITGSKLGAKDLSVFKERQDIPIEIRMLLGEYSDPALNYAKTVLKLSSLAANHKFLTDIKKSGMGTYFYEKNDPRRSTEFNTMIATEGSETMNPLNGLYTTKEIAEAFMAQPSQLSDFWKTFMKFQSSIRWLKTIGSIATHIKNVFGNIGFVWINAHFDAKEVGRAFMTVKNDFSKGNNQQRRDKMNNYISLGIVKQSAGLGEVMDMFKDANWDTAMASRLSNEKIGLMGKAKRLFLQGKKKIEDAYQAEDDFFKIIAYENELSRYSKAMFNKSKTELTEEELVEVNNVVTEIVKNTYPTYDRIPEAIKMVRRAPFIGNFVSFQAESYRTAFNTVALAKNELTSDNKKIKAIGAQRLAGATTYLSAKSAILAYFSMAAGTGLTGLAGYLFDDDDEEKRDKDIREFVAPWSKKSDLLMVSVGDGKIKYIDFSSSDPHGALKKVMNAFFLGDTTIDGFSDGIVETFSPFIGEDMTVEALLALKNNQDKYGNPIYNSEESLEDQSQKVLAYMYKLVEPGTFSSIRRGWEAEDKANELVANLTGFRTYDVDVNQQFGYKMKDLSERISNAKKIYNSKYYNEKATESEKKAAYDKSNEALKKIYSDVISVYNSAERLGCKPEDLGITMKEFGGMSKESITEIQSGKAPELKKKEE